MDRFIRIIIIVHSSHISDFSKVFEKKKKKKQQKKNKKETFRMVALSSYS